LSKAIFEFTLPEEQETYNIYRQAMDMNIALSNIREWIRHLRKYEDRELIPVEELADKFFEILADNGVEI
jgi:hypothetical protein